MAERARLTIGTQDLRTAATPGKAGETESLGSVMQDRVTFLTLNHVDTLITWKRKERETSVYWALAH